MVCSLLAVDGNTALLQQLMKKCSSELRGIFNRQSLVSARIVERHIAPQGQQSRAGFTVDENFSRDTRGRGDDAIVNFVILREWRDADECTLSHMIGWLDVYENNIVVNGERG